MSAQPSLLDPEVIGPRGPRHLSRSWTMPDPFAASCGCAVAACGGAVEGSSPSCSEHSIAAGKTIRTSHSADRCPGISETSGAVPGGTENVRASHSEPVSRSG